MGNPLALLLLFFGTLMGHRADYGSAVDVAADNCTLQASAAGLGYRFQCAGGCANGGPCAVEAVVSGQQEIYACGCGGVPVDGCSAKAVVTLIPGGDLLWWTCENKGCLVHCKEGENPGPAPAWTTLC